MQAVLWTHIVAGGLGILSGFVALYASKGAPLHRRAGLVFVTVMLTMALSGIVLALVEGAAPELNVPAAVVTGYLVVTGWTAVRPPARGGRTLGLVAAATVTAVGLASLAFGLEALGPAGGRGGMPAFPFFLFAAIAAMGVVGDVRLLRTGPPTGATRLARHLWRMGFALFVATMSFFLGQADVIPKPIRIPPLLAAPPLSVLVTMLWWLWRVRARRNLRGTIVRPAPGAPGAPATSPGARIP